MSEGSASGNHADRTMDERIALAMPSSVVRIMLRGLNRLPPGSPLRRRLLKRAFVRGFAGGSRGDYDFLLLFYEPDVEIRFVSEVPRTLGLAESYNGHRGFVDAWRDYHEEIHDLRITPNQVVDLGYRAAVRVSVVGRGRASGIETAEVNGHVFHFSQRGLFERQEIYRRWDEVLAALKR